MSAVQVTGYLGAGKSTLAAHLSAEGLVTNEVPALMAPAAGTPVIAVVDAANLITCLADPLVAPLIRAQVTGAGLVVVSRGDIIDAGPAVSVAKELTTCPVLKAPMGQVEPAHADSLSISTTATPMDLTDQFARWDYEGPAKLRPEALEQLMAERPAGTYRMWGTALTTKGTVAVEIAGQVRQTASTDDAETRLSAVGPRNVFRPENMALAFAEAASKSAFMAGMFGHR
ncbi:MAG: hypothetical protein AAF674_05210 [Pseudomonadota bacterium]